MKAIQEWLGYSTFHIIANFYSHMDFNLMIELANTIASILDGDFVQKALVPKKLVQLIYHI